MSITFDLPACTEQPIIGLYAHDDPEHVHAVTSYRGNTYSYDANGNMESRTVDGVSYTLTYDAENGWSAWSGAVPL